MIEIMLGKVGYWSGVHALYKEDSTDGSTIGALNLVSTDGAH